MKVDKEVYMADQKFIDEDGLRQFWEDVQKKLTRMYPNLNAETDPAGKYYGKEIARVYQKDGQVHVELGEFGGNTEDAKKASRASLKVGIYKGFALVDDINARTQQREFNHGDIITVSTYSGTIVNPYPYESIDVNPGDSVIRCIFDGSGGHAEFWQKLAYKTYVSNSGIAPAEPGINVVTSVTQNESTGTIDVVNKRVGLLYHGESGANRISFG
jgi:hypothetical protein